MDHTLRSVPRQERSSKAIQDILQAAERLTRTSGIDELTIANVAEEAAISAGKVYYWFEDKQALIEAVRARRHDSFEAFLRSTLSFVDIDDAAGLVDNYVRGFVDYMQQNPTALELLDRDVTRTGENAFRELMIRLVTPLLSVRVTGITDDEARFVVRNLVNVMIAMTAEVIVADRAEQPAMLTEMVYLLYGYLHSRYPHESDQVWDHPDYPLQPSLPVAGAPRSRPVFPAQF